MDKPHYVLLYAAFAWCTFASGATTTTSSAPSGNSTAQWHHVCVSCGAPSLHNVTGLRFERNESVYSGECATQIYAGVTTFTESAHFSTDAFSVLHLLECITEALATNGTFYCNDSGSAVACDNANHIVIAFCHNHTRSVEHPAPLAAISWAAALYTAITLAGIFTLNYV
uniref:GP4 protein n=1 Tax=Free State vervet virus TaxID=1737586 RepID=A0A159D6S6_9NIDO|nr:GP4 protein [Free State vervet virus]